MARPHIVITKRLQDRYVHTLRALPDTHRQRREGDEMACSCGKRWPVREDHP